MNFAIISSVNFPQIGTEYPDLPYHTAVLGLAVTTFYYKFLLLLFRNNIEIFPSEENYPQLLCLKIFAEDLIMFLNKSSLKLQDKTVLICKTYIATSHFEDS